MATTIVQHGHQVDQELRKLNDIASTLDAALADAQQLKHRNPNLERMIREAHHECTFMAAGVDDYLNSFV